LILLKSNKKKLGNEHPDTAQSYTDVGLLYSQLGNHSAAITYLNSALKIRKKAIGTDIDVAQSYYDLGMAYEKMGGSAKASEHKNMAIALWEGKYSSISRGADGVVVADHEKVYYEKESHTIVDILYGTDRAINKAYKVDDSLEGFFTGDRSKLRYGVAQVSIPKTHTFGKMERPSNNFLSFSKETVGEHVVIKQLEDMDSQEFIETINAKLIHVKENDILVFIHGYNVSFASAIRRTAQLSYDLEFKGVPFTYSWPSKSETDEYWTDESSVQYTVPHLVTFLKDIIDNNEARENKADIHILGHSMGTRALSYAVKELSFAYNGKQLFENIIFAAPDIDKDVFELSIFPYVKKTTRNITLYANSDDKALMLSASMHGGERVGQGGDDIFVFNDLDTIDASGIDAGYFSLSHSYFSKKEVLVNDLRDVIYKSLPPSKRKSLIEKSKEKLAYWALKFE